MKGLLADLQQVKLHADGSANVLAVAANDVMGVAHPFDVHHRK